MIINSRGANFVLNFPKTFWTEATIKKYTPYIKRLPIPYDTLNTFMASTVQSVTFPSLTMDPVTQIRTLGKKQEYKNSVPLPDLFTRDISITFKTLDAYINYWIFLDNMMNYLNFSHPTPKEYTDDIQLRFLNAEGYVVTTTLFKGAYFKGLSELQLSYSDNNPDFKTFTADFGFYDMEILIEAD